MVSQYWLPTSAWLSVPRRYAHGVRVDLAEPSSFGRPADSSVLRQCFDPSIHVGPLLSCRRTFSNPAIFSVVGSDQDYQIISNDIVGV